MKNRTIVLLFSVCLIGYTSCTNNQSKDKIKPIDRVNKETPIAKESNENFDWMLGKWIRANEEPGKETFEVWNKISNDFYDGIGYTMQGGDTIKQEKIKILRSKGQWKLVVKVPEDLRAITFNITKIGKDHFTCENKKIDFPKKIKYWQEGPKMRALVSGDGVEIGFEFDQM